MAPRAEEPVGAATLARAADRYDAWLKNFTAKLDERAEPIVHRRSKHLASAMAGLELILDNLGDELPAAERQAITSILYVESKHALRKRF